MNLMASTGTTSPAKKVIAQELHSWMVKYGIDETVEVLGRDSTNKMSGWSGGSIAWM